MGSTSIILRSGKPVKTNVEKPGPSPVELREEMALTDRKIRAKLNALDEQAYRRRQAQGEEKRP
jgi:hypothetical protein